MLLICEYFEIKFLIHVEIDSIDTVEECVRKVGPVTPQLGVCVAGNMRYASVIRRPYCIIYNYFLLFRILILSCIVVVVLGY